jgi:drug/metabolite transporter (DMT)-like permease
MVRASLARSSRPPGAKGAGHAHQRDDTDDIVLDADGYTPSERDCAADAVSLASVHGKLEGATFAHANGVGFELNSKEQFAHRVYMPSCLWTAGFSVFLVGNVLDFIALGLTKVSIVTLVGSGSLVVNTVMARLLLKEIVTTLDIMSAVCIILGISLTVIGNQSEVKEWPVEELVQQYSRPDVVVMLVMFTGVIVTCLLIMAMDTTRRRAVAARTGVAPRPSRWIGAITCIVGAFVATFTILFGKAFSNLILLTIAGDNQFTDIITVLIVLAFMVRLSQREGGAARPAGVDA